MSRLPRGRTGTAFQRIAVVSKRTVTVFEMGLREYARTPVLLALLVFLPAYFVGVLVYLMPDTTVPLDVPGSGTVTVASAEVYGVVLVPLLCGLIGGLAGLFLMLAARDADARLAVAGYRPAEILAARTALLGVAGLVASGVSLLALSIRTVPESLGWFVAASVVAALTYGMVGTLAGLVLSRLAGVYVMLFVPMMDVFFFQNPLVSDPHWLASYLPGHYVTAVAVDAGFSATVALEPLAKALAYLGLLTLLAGTAYYQSVRVM